MYFVVARLLCIFRFILSVAPWWLVGPQLNCRLVLILVGEGGKEKGLLEEGEERKKDKMKKKI